MSSGGRHPWGPWKYPGDAVLVERLVKDGEIGEIIVQRYAQFSMCVACFLPGRYVQVEGDTPKTEPELQAWAKTHGGADRLFDAYLARALADGWALAGD